MSMSSILAGHGQRAGLTELLSEQDWCSERERSALRGDVVQKGRSEGEERWSSCQGPQSLRTRMETRPGRVHRHWHTRCFGFSLPAHSPALILMSKPLLVKRQLFP